MDFLLMLCAIAHSELMWFLSSRPSWILNRYQALKLSLLQMFQSMVPSRHIWCYLASCCQRKRIKYILTTCLWCVISSGHSTIKGQLLLCHWILMLWAYVLLPWWGFRINLTEFALFIFLRLDVFIFFLPDTSILYECSQPILGWISKLSV